MCIMNHVGLDFIKSFIKQTTAIVASMNPFAGWKLKKKSLENGQGDYWILNVDLMRQNQSALDRFYFCF